MSDDYDLYHTYLQYGNQNSLYPPLSMVQIATPIIPTVKMSELQLSAKSVVNAVPRGIHENVLNFGAPDNYWCYNFERAVERYVTISNNHKNIEVTFARTELRREILKVRSSLKIQESYSETGICLISCPDVTLFYTEK